MNTNISYKHVTSDRVRCPNCSMIYPKPDGPLQSYYCGNCGYPHLVPVPQSSTDRQAALAVAGALAGAGLAGVPGAIVGGIIGYLTGSSE